VEIKVMNGFPFLAGKVAVVTGASRGIGKGIATVLEARGTTVYVTGRTTAAGSNATSGSINEVAKTIAELGGVGIAVRCDHADDAKIKALFEQVETEQGNLDISVNHIRECREIRAIFGFLRERKADLMIIGPHQRDFYIARLWSTAYELGREGPCNILGVK
jgi:NAD(P)-dependent dehydrogenase (short-subunit alcohol dehydrogenase family)